MYHQFIDGYFVKDLRQFIHYLLNHLLEEMRQCHSIINLSRDIL